MADTVKHSNPQGFYHAISPPQRASSRSSRSGQVEDDASISRLDQAHPDHSPGEPFIATGPGKLAKAFQSRHQLHTLMIDNFLRWLLTAIVILFIYVTLKVFEKKGATSNYYSNWFNVIVTGLSILLALNYFSALKELAKILRWRILANRYHTARQIDLILACESLAVLCILAYHNALSIFRARSSSVRKHQPSKSENNVAYSKTSAALLSIFKIFLWVSINLAAQAAIASISLAYNFQSAGAPITQPHVPTGPSYVSDLSVIYPLTFTNSPPRGPGDQQAAAHALGDVGAVFSTDTVEDMNDAATRVNSEQYYAIAPGFNEDDQKRWGYRFFNYDKPSFFSYAYSVPTEATIETSWDKCHEFPVLYGYGGPDSTTTITYLNGTEQHELGVQGVGQNTTTFIYPLLGCSDGNPRCARLWAFQEPSGTNGAFLYDCEVSVSRVSNGNAAIGQDIPDLQANYLAAAAGLSGVPNTDVVFESNGTATMYQFQRYILDSYWSLAGMSGDQAGRKMAEFSIAAIAGMAEINQKILHQDQPYVVPAVQLYVHWDVIRVLLPALVLIHFIFFVTTVFLANPYVVRDDSNLATALLLRPLLNRIYTSDKSKDDGQDEGRPGSFIVNDHGEAMSGSYLNGIEIAELVEQSLEGKDIVYGHRPSVHTHLGTLHRQGGVFELGLYSDGMKPRKMAEKRQSDGIYV